MPSRRVVRPSRPVYNPVRPAPGKRSLSVNPNHAKMAFKYGLLAAAGLLLFSYFSVRGVDIVGLQHVSEQSLRLIAEDSLNRRFLLGNLITLRPGELSSDIMAAEYRVKKVEVRRKWPNRLVLSVEERQPSLNWQTGGISYLLDIDGSVIGPSGESGLPTVIDNANLPVQKGDKVAPVRFVQFVGQLAGELTAQSGLKIAEMRVPDTTSELYIKTDKGYVVKFDTTRGVEEELVDLKNVLASLAKLKKDPAEYIDLRVPNKAYWR